MHSLNEPQYFSKLQKLKLVSRESSASGVCSSTRVKSTHVCACGGARYFMKISSFDLGAHALPLIPPVLLLWTPVLTRDTRVDVRANHVLAIVVLERWELHVLSPCATD